jgi:hypothetical protein
MKIDLAEAQGSQRKRRIIRFSVTAAPPRRCERFLRS